jgi:hypothetical protein
MRIQAGERAPRFTKSSEQQEYSDKPIKDYELYRCKQTEADGLLDEEVQDSIRAQEDGFYDEVHWTISVRTFMLMMIQRILSGYWSSYMSDIAAEYSLDWPYMTGGQWQQRRVVTGTALVTV